MKKEQLTRIIIGAVIVVLGVLIAVFGAESVLDTFFGIAGCVAGGCLLGFGIYQIAKKQEINPMTIILGSVLLAVGITLFTPWLSVGILINLLVIVVLGAGAGLVFFGVYKIAKKEVSFGILNIVVGVVAITLAALYLGLPEFRKVFWIIVGIVVATYGCVETVLAIVKK